MRRAIRITSGTWFRLSLGLAVAVCWALPARNPLSRDETGTYWIVKDSLADVVARSYYWTNWSPYYLIAWMAVHLGGKHEWVMRAPSILAMVLATFLVARLGRRLWDAETGMLAAFMFAIMPDVAFAASDARPYAFTLVVLSAYALVVLQWIDTGRLRDAIAAALLAALVAYGHILLALGVVVPAIYAAWRRPQWTHLLVAACIAGIALVPLVIQLRAYVGMDTMHQPGFLPTLDDLWATLVSGQFLVTIAVGAVLAFLLLPDMEVRWGLSKTTTVLLVAWMLFPPAFLFLLARTTTIRLFIPRYMLSTAIPQAVVYAALIRAVVPVKARAMVLAPVFLISVGAFLLSAKAFHGEGWRDALAAVRAEVGVSDVPLVMSSPFAEAQRADNMTDPRLREVLYAPAVYYGAPGHLIPLPFFYDEAYLDHVVDSDLRDQRDFVLLTSSVPTVRWFEKRLADRGVEARRVGEFRGLQVYRFKVKS